MKEELEMPFSFSPSENEKESCLSKNILLLIFIIIGVILVAGIIVTIIIITTFDVKADTLPEPEESDIETNNTNFIKVVYNITKISERTKIYNVYTNPPNYYNMSELISSIKIDNKKIEINRHDGTHQFDKKGIYTLNIYFKEDLHYIEGFFMYCTDIIEVDLTNLTTTEIDSMSSLFKGCIKLKKIVYGDKFNTEKLNHMDELFALCESLEEIDLTKFDTKNVFSMKSLFQGCQNLKNIIFGNFNTKRVEEMRNMFNGCSSLKSIDLSKFDTSKVSNFENMFARCSSLTTIDTKYIYTNSSIDMSGMFEECTNFVYLDLNHFDTSQVKDMSTMFSDCTNLQSLNLKGFNTEGVVSMEEMFTNCKSLTSLDLSSFNTPNLIDIDRLFSGCSSLNELNIPKFNTTLVQESNEIFNEVPEGGKITYNSSILTTNIINNIPQNWNITDINKKK